MTHNSAFLDPQTLTPDHTKIFEQFSKRVQRGQHRAARTLFDANQWLARIETPQAWFEWFDLPLGATGAPTIEAGLDTLDFLLEKKFPFVMDESRSSYRRVMGWFEQSPNHPHVNWFRDHGLITDQMAADYQKAIQAGNDAVQSRRTGAIEVLNKCRSPLQRLELIRANIKPWLDDNNFRWADHLNCAEEALVAVKTLRTVNKSNRQNPETKDTHVGGNSAIGASYITIVLFENPEWVSEELFLQMVRCGRESMGGHGDSMPLGTPWHRSRTASQRFARGGANFHHKRRGLG